MTDGITLKHDIMSPTVKVGGDTNQSLCTVLSQCVQCMIGDKSTCVQHNIYLRHAAVMESTQRIMKSHCFSRRTL